MTATSIVRAVALLALLAGPVLAQSPGTVETKPLPARANPNDPSTPAKELFGRELAPAKIPPRAVGFYSKGCLAGAEPVPINGESWRGCLRALALLR